MRALEDGLVSKERWNTLVKLEGSRVSLQFAVQVCESQLVEHTFYNNKNTHLYYNTVCPINKVLLTLKVTKGLAFFTLNPWKTLCIYCLYFCVCKQPVQLPNIV